MAHHRLRSQAASDEAAALFSPSVARAAASTAKDWAYVDAWLRHKYQLLDPKSRVPSFERNAGTLKALLDLVAANEAADEEREQLFRVEEAALEEVANAEAEREKRRRGQDNAQDNGPPGNRKRLDGDLIVEDLLQSIDSALPASGRAALDAMADMSVSLGLAYPSSPSTSSPATTLSYRFLQLQAKAFQLQETLHRVSMLQEYLDVESARMDTFIHDLREGEAYRPELDPNDQARQNAEIQHNISALATRLPEMKRQMAYLQKAVGAPPLTVEEVRRDEEAYLDSLARKKDLDAQVKAFAGLPPDIEAARMELEALRADLRDTTGRRDANFEKLVERESPIKARRT